MANRLNRRQFLRNTTLAGVGATLAQSGASARKFAANDKLNLGIIGVAGRGGDNLAGVSGQNIVALCDIDDNYLARRRSEYPQAKTYNDFKKLIEAKGLDAVVVSTPDHIHAPAAAMALEAGLHVYCEKPLAHTVYEARVLAGLAKKHSRATQMGTQIHAGSNYRRVVEMIRYDPAYLPATWRGFWAFGSGTLGDMGCHHMDLSHWALDLRAPQTVSAEGPPVDPEITPPWLIVHLDYPARGEQPPVRLNWYHGEKRPAAFAEGKLPEWGDGTLFVGEKGMLLADYDRRVLLPEKDFTDYVPPAPTIPDSIGHYEEWFAAIRTGSPTTCNFDYSGALSEAVLLGKVAYRTGQTLNWDAHTLRATNCPEADGFIHPHYRHGWRL